MGGLKFRSYCDLPRNFEHRSDSVANLDSKSLVQQVLYGRFAQSIRKRSDSHLMSRLDVGQFSAVGILRKAIRRPQIEIIKRHPGAYFGGCKPGEFAHHLDVP